MMLIPCDGKTMVSITHTFKDGAQRSVDIWCSGTEVPDLIAKEILDAHGFLITKFQPIVDTKEVKNTKKAKVLEETEAFA